MHEPKQCLILATIMMVKKSTPVLGILIGLVLLVGVAVVVVHPIVNMSNSPLPSFACCCTIAELICTNPKISSFPDVGCTLGR